MRFMQSGSNQRLMRRTEYGRALALFIHGFRETQRMTQARLAELVHVRTHTIQEIEWGFRKVRLNSGLRDGLGKIGLPREALGQPTIAAAMTYLRTQGVPRERIREWKAALGIEPRGEEQGEQILLHSTLADLSKEGAGGAEEEIFRRLAYYTAQADIEGDAEEVLLATPIVSMTIVPPSWQAREIEASYGASVPAQCLIHRYQSRAASVVCGVQSGRIHRLRALSLAGPTRRFLSSAKNSGRLHQFDAFLRGLDVHRALDLRLLDDGTLRGTDRERFSAIAIRGKGRIAVAVSDQAYDSAVHRERRVERDTPYTREQFELLEEYWQAGRPVTINELVSP